MAGDWTRRQVLTTAGSVVAGVAGLGAAAYVGNRFPRSTPATAASSSPAPSPSPSPTAPAGPAEGVRHFASRPDLSPPVVTVTPNGAGPAPGPDASRCTFVATKDGPGQAGMMIVDRQGEPVWLRPVVGPAAAMNFTTQTYRGQPVLTWWEGQIVHGVGYGTSYIADSSYRTIHAVRAGNGVKADLHEFLITPDDTALITAYRHRQADLSAIGGPASGTVLSGVVQEIDIATGRVLLEWDSFDHVALTETHQSLSGTGTAKKPFDYFHVNSIAILPDGDLLISARNTWAVYKLARADGSVKWRLGGKKSSFTLGPGVEFYWQHHARPHGPGMLSIFDDGAAPPEERQSRAIFVALHTASMHASLERAYTHPAGLLAKAMGNVQVLPDGRVFVGWGAEPYYSEFAPGGRLLMDGQFPAGDHSYRAFSLPWQGRPIEPPAVAVSTNPDGGTMVYASWNGATRVSRWAVLAGRAASTLAHAGSQARAGFETAIAVTSTGPYFVAVALDSRGRELARSRAVKLAAT